MEWRMLKMECEDGKDGMEIWPLDDIPDRKHQPGRGASAEARHHAYRKKTKTTKKKINITMSGEAEKCSLGVVFSCKKRPFHRFCKIIHHFLQGAHP